MTKIDHLKRFFNFEKGIDRITSNKNDPVGLPPSSIMASGDLRIEEALKDVFPGDQNFDCEVLRYLKPVVSKRILAPYNYNAMPKEVKEELKKHTDTLKERGKEILKDAETILQDESEKMNLLYEGKYALLKS